MNLKKNGMPTYLTSPQRKALYREVHHDELWLMDWPAKAIEMLEAMEDHAEAADSIIEELRKAIHDMMSHATGYPNIGCQAAIQRGRKALEKLSRMGI